MEWTRNNRLPDAEPDDDNRDAYASPQLLSGASDDGMFAYDAVWVEMEQCFVLTFLYLNDDLGFVEDERRVYPETRADLLAQVAAFEACPTAVFE